MGTLTLDTGFDLSGAEKGYKRLEQTTKEVARKAANEIAGIGNAFDDISGAIKRQQSDVNALRSEYDKAVTTLAELRDVGFKDVDLSVQIAEVERLSAELEGAEQKLSELKGTAAQVGKTAPKAMRDTGREAKNATKSTKGLGDSLSRTVSRIKNLLVSVMVFNVLRSAFKGFRDYIGLALKDNQAFANSFAQVKGNLQTAFQPILDVIIPILTKLMQWLSTVTQYIVQFISVLSGKSVKAMQDSAKNMDKLAANTKKAGKEAKNALAPFDEISQLTQSTADAADAADAFAPQYADIEEPDFSWTEPFKNAMSDIRKALEPFKEAVGAGLAWFWENALKPLGSWVFNKALPSFLEAISAVFPGLNNNLKILGGAFKTLWDIALKPIMSFVGNAILSFFDWIKNHGQLVADLLTAIVFPIGLLALEVAKFVFAKDAILSLEDAMERLENAQKNLETANDNYIASVDKARDASLKLAEAEETTKLSGAELFKQVQAGTLDYANMTDAQREVYKAYLENETAQINLKKATEDLKAAKKNETIASLENQLAIAAESGKYDDFKKSVVEAYEAGEISADEARDLIEKSMSRMSRASQKTFMEDLPGDIKEGLDPKKYETNGQKIDKWFGGLWDGIKNKAKSAWDNIKAVWGAVSTWFKEKVTDPIKDAFKSAINGIIGFFEGMANGVIGTFERLINWIISGINKISFKMPDLLGGATIGFNIPEVSLGRVNIPRLATGTVVPPNKEFMAILGDNKHEHEVVSPVSKIEEAVENVLARRGDIGSNRPITVIFELNRRELARAVHQLNNEETQRVGVKLSNV